ncbi:MAG: methyltransferase, partial [Peptococcaceae bacterium]|nr:methyltransferase [Peptococcaceae bacterium]
MCPTSISVLPDEAFTDLCIQHDIYGYATSETNPHIWKVLQKTQGFRFSIDAVLLAHFITPNPDKPQRLLDLGTGSGVMPLLLAARYDKLQIDGIELQAEIADMAKRSVSYNGMEDHIRIYQQDITQLPKSFEQQYDFVISNPPFFQVGTGKQNPNPQIALARHE